MNYRSYPLSLIDVKAQDNDYVPSISIFCGMISLRGRITCLIVDSCICDLSTYMDSNQLSVSGNRNFICLGNTSQQGITAYNVYMNNKGLLYVGNNLYNTVDYNYSNFLDLSTIQIPCVNY